jgi:hypothetical protein
VSSSDACAALVTRCCGLTLDRVDFLRRQITVDRQLVWLFTLNWGAIG